MLRKPVTGLQLPTVSPPEQQKIHSTWDTIDKVEGEIAMKGFVPMDTPEFQCPQITPELLADADNKEYTTAYSQQNAWFNYASQVLAQVSSMLLQCENEMEMIDSRICSGLRRELKESGEKMSAKQMQDEVNLDPRYAEVRLQAQVYKQKKIQLSAFLDGIERGLRLISRQVEIRRMESDQNRTNIPGREFQRPGQPWRGRDPDEGNRG